MSDFHRVRLISSLIFSFIFLGTQRKWNQFSSNFVRISKLKTEPNYFRFTLPSNFLKDSDSSKSNIFHRTHCRRTFVAHPQYLFCLLLLLAEWDMCGLLRTYFFPSNPLINMLANWPGESFNWFQVRLLARYRLMLHPKLCWTLSYLSDVKTAKARYTLHAILW